MRSELAWVMALVVGVSGCVGGSPAQDDVVELGEDVQVEVTATTGAIRGVVVDEAIRPLAGAQVKLNRAEGALFTNTTEAGSFSFSNLEPGTYFVEASRFGYGPVQQSVEVVAGDDDPPVVRMLLVRDPSQVAYYTAQTFSGFIVCTSSVVAMCGAPNVISNVLLCPVFGVCLGNVTDDRFGWDFFYEPNATYIQSEIVWDSTQPLSTQLSLQMETIQGCEDEYYERTVAGDSPIINFANETEIAEAKIGGDCSIFHSLFSGDTAGTPLGLTLQQQYDSYTFSFYGYLPPEGWTFTADGNPPAPPT